MALFGKNSLELFHSDKCLIKFKAKHDRANKNNEAN